MKTKFLEALKEDHKRVYGTESEIEKLLRKNDFIKKFKLILDMSEMEYDHDLDNYDSLNIYPITYGSFALEIYGFEFELEYCTDGKLYMTMNDYADLQPKSEELFSLLHLLLDHIELDIKAFEVLAKLKD